MTQASSRHSVATLDAGHPSSDLSSLEPRLPGLDARPERPGAESGDRDSLIDHLRDALASRSPLVREIAEEGLRSWPADPELLLLAALAALAMDLPERALSLLKRYGKRYVPGKPVTLLTGLALAQQRRFTHAWTMLHAAGLDNDRAALAWFVGDTVMAGARRLLQAPPAAGTDHSFQ